MHQYQEIDRQEARTPGGKNIILHRDTESVALKEEDVRDRTKWRNDIHHHSGDPK